MNLYSPEPSAVSSAGARCNRRENSGGLALRWSAISEYRKAIKVPREWSTSFRGCWWRNSRRPQLLKTDAVRCCRIRFSMPRPCLCDDRTINLPAFPDLGRRANV